MRTFLVITVLLAACKPSVDPVLTCQHRIVNTLLAVQPADAVGEGWAWGRGPLTKLNRKGCDNAQLAKIDKLVAMTYEIERLQQETRAAGKTGNEELHMAAFRRLSKALLAHIDLKNELIADLDQMQAKQVN